MGVSSTLPICTICVVPIEKLETNYISDGNCGLSYKQLEGEADVDTYFEEVVIPTANYVDPDPDETDLISTNAKINTIRVKCLHLYLKARNLSMKRKNCQKELFMTYVALKIQSQLLLRANLMI